ncbi:phosphate/phosphite/phosphonate ABC transporter substrate-binding protein [Citricoccus sp. SGAir0253]|uniref:phosphate/phosphite/phosphonate ABC transporter substrate-binding protein n=1 Tax=Citricoccus sp. SGAir0253 TaxID=2567881 RepID=UPI0010CD4F00|nr:phosphate/phosphite/phosphonate ABC transporter substrate-binding protein [Citricoccus sp. SGAir0253]QCU78222.1 phosphate/phosphite/phosphonate ABC transporter substrate-binding protein [Citricoccus sp. SGAir0253]
MKTARLESPAVRAAALAAVTVPFLAACGGGADGGETLTFAAIPAESSASLESDYSNITALIEQETGVDVEFQNASDYAAVIEGQRAGQIDIASYGPFSYVIAKDSGVNIEPVAAPTSDQDKQPAYTSLAYVRADSDIQDLADLEGKKVCFVDAASTSGYLVPMKGLLDEGIDLNTETEAVLAGGHDASLLSLDAGSCDAAFAHDTMLNTLVTSGQVDEGALKPVWESAPITEDPIALNMDTIEPELAEQISTVIREKANKPALVEAGICASEEDCVLPEEIEYGYLPVDDSDFDAIREICAATDADACHSVG